MIPSHYMQMTISSPDHTKTYYLSKEQSDFYSNLKMHHTSLYTKFLSVTLVFGIFGIVCVLLLLIKSSRKYALSALCVLPIIYYIITNGLNQQYLNVANEIEQYLRPLEY